MLLGQDFCHAGEIEARLAKKPNENPFYHYQGNKTNIRLCELLSPFFDLRIDGGTARTCGVYYGNATWLLKDGKGLNGALPNPKAALALHAEILQATIAGMPHLRKILCLGKAAYEAAGHLFKTSRDWRGDLDAGYFEANGLRICPLSHPGPLGTNMRRESMPTAARRALIDEDFRRHLEA